MPSSGHIAIRNPWITIGRVSDISNKGLTHLGCFRESDPLTKLIVCFVSN
jgi:hypothetical protein